MDLLLRLLASKGENPITFEDILREGSRETAYQFILREVAPQYFQKHAPEVEDLMTAEALTIADEVIEKKVPPPEVPKYVEGRAFEASRKIKADLRLL